MSGYQTFTRTRMPWQRALPNATILLLDDDGTPLLALTPAAAEDLADSLRRQAGYIRAGKFPTEAAS